MSIIVTGHSDDLIELDGDIRDEFYADEEDDGGDLLTFSDGTILHIEYVNDTWRIKAIAEGSGFLCLKTAEEGDEGSYTDLAELVGATWVRHGSLTIEVPA